MTTITLTINNAPHTLTVPPMKRLLDVLREDLHLTGTKEGCGEGECGACAILFNNELANSCLIPALQASNATITTIEGLAPNIAPTTDPLPSTLCPPSPALHPIQQCFLEQGGAQCGICTPGMILATHHLLTQHPNPTAAEIQEGLAGNLCRCTGYMRIFESVQQAATHQAAKPTELPTP
ncbi:MAG: (2Fe-2S)-binding protein [Acidobacteriaceae bacterium]